MCIGISNCPNLTCVGIGLVGAGRRDVDVDGAEADAAMAVEEDSSGDGS
jgi:hypothetical protein